MEHIVGATFNKICTYKNDFLVAQDITNIDIKVQIYTLDNILLGNVTVTKIAPTQGTFQMRAETTGWIAGTAIFDIRFIINGNIVFSDKTKMNLIQSFTKPA